MEVVGCICGESYKSFYGNGSFMWAIGLVIEILFFFRLESLAFIDVRSGCSRIIEVVVI